MHQPAASEFAKGGEHNLTTENRKARQAKAVPTSAAQPNHRMNMPSQHDRAAVESGGSLDRVVTPLDAEDGERFVDADKPAVVWRIPGVAVVIAANYKTFDLRTSLSPETQLMMQIGRIARPRMDEIAKNDQSLWGELIDQHREPGKGFLAAALRRRETAFPEDSRLAQM